jgi:hypothetical protein
MKDDPNDKVVAGDVPDIIRARRGWGVNQI